MGMYSTTSYKKNIKKGGICYVDGSKRIYSRQQRNLRPYDGTEVVVTLLEHPVSKKQKPAVDWDSFSIPSERGKDVDGYMREMRENDRL